MVYKHKWPKPLSCWTLTCVLLRKGRLSWLLQKPNRYCWDAGGKKKKDHPPVYVELITTMSQLAAYERVKYLNKPLWAGYKLLKGQCCIWRLVFDFGRIPVWKFFVQFFWFLFLIAWRKNNTIVRDNKSNTMCETQDRNEWIKMLKIIIEKNPSTKAPTITTTQQEQTYILLFFSLSFWFVLGNTMEDKCECLTVLGFL